MRTDLSVLLAYVEKNPLTTLACLVGIGVVWYLLQRKPAIQRRADERLATLRSENSGQYDRLRPLD